MSDDLLPYFLEEGRELAERAGEALAEVRRGAGAGALEQAFRAFHTLKGGAALFDFAELGALLHAAESELERARRDGAPAPERLDALDACVSEAERWLDALEAKGEVAPERRQAAAALAERLIRHPRMSGDPGAGRRALPDEFSRSEYSRDPRFRGDDAKAARTVRVEAAALDSASDLLDQLILAKNALAHETGAPGAGVARAQLALDRAAAALHEALGRMRLAPLRRLFAPLPRQIGEMAEALGKSVELTVSGEEIALDKAILDGLYEPLVHILRNAVDHGVEPPEARRAAGKPERGAIRIAAVPRGDVAEIVVSDDGGGLDISGIRAAAAERGVVSDAALADMSDAEAADLIFAPGFSTARAVTEISGRGVGLDAVRAALARLGGRVEIENRPGQGVDVRMTAPLRTVLTRVAVLAVGAERFGAPLHSILEIVRVRRSEVSKVRTGEAVVVRDAPVPLLRLGALLGGEPADLESFPVLIVDGGGERVGVAVDRVDAVLQAPIQAASPLLSGLTGVLGSMLQGDGRILLLLDIPALTHDRKPSA